MKNISYEELTNRNFLYIDDETQAKMRDTKVAFFGCGLASTTLEYTGRMGFGEIYLWDGDHVEASNVNRQNFVFKDAGRKKVACMKQRLAAINPLTVLHTGTSYIQDLDEIKDIIDSYDMVVNTVDCGPLYFDIIEYTRKQGKLVLCPFNLGFHGLMACFTDKSASAYEMFECDEPVNDLGIAQRILKHYPEICEDMGRSPENFLGAVIEANHFPQLVVAGALASSLVVTNMIRFLAGKPIRLAPEYQHLKAY